MPGCGHHEHLGCPDASGSGQQPGLVSLGKAAPISGKMNWTCHALGSLLQRRLGGSWSGDGTCTFPLCAVQKLSNTKILGKLGVNSHVLLHAAVPLAEDCCRYQRPFLIHSYCCGRYVSGLFALAHDSSSEVRKVVCTGLVQMLQLQQQRLQPHMKEIIEYMLQATQVSLL